MRACGWRRCPQKKCRVVLAIALLRVEKTARGIVRGTANFPAHARQREQIPPDFREAAADRLLHKPVVVHLPIEVL